MLIEETAIPDAALPIEPFKAHLRLGTGFGTDSLQDGLLGGFLRAAIAAIEGRTGKVLIARDFTWVVHRWLDRTGEVIPVGPVQAVIGVTLVAADADETALADGWWLERDAHRPRLCPAGALLPAVPRGGSVRVGVRAGMAADWGGLPADLGQAVLMLAAHYYEYRDDTGLSEGCMPFGVTSLIQRYRVLRLTPGVGR